MDEQRQMSLDELEENMAVLSRSIVGEEEWHTSRDIWGSDSTERNLKTKSLMTK